MSHHTVLLDQFARFLAAHDVGEYSDGAAFSPGKRGIVVGVFPEVPAEVVAVSFFMPEYQRLNGGARRLTATRIQIRTRVQGPPLASLDLFDHLTYLIDRKHLTLGPLRATGAFVSATDLIPTKSAGWMQSSNWSLTALEGLPTL